MPIRALQLPAAAVLALLVAAPGPVAEKPPVVVELFTSQGCSSCPPADAFLGELAKRPDVIALAFHVDYWDYIGWKDPYALPDSTERQRRYTTALGNHFLYTPEMVVDGRHDATGSDRDTVDALIRKSESVPKIRIGIKEPSEGHYAIELPASPGFKGAATVWMAEFERQHETSVARGENEGRTLHEFNTVRTLRALARWQGQAMTVPLDWMAKPTNGCAILLQADNAAGPGQGPILGAALIKED
jgi:hypothetical protein